MRKYITEKKNTLSLLFICVGLVFCGWVGNNWRFKTHEDREEIAVRSAEWYAIGGNVIYTNSGFIYGCSCHLPRISILHLQFCVYNVVTGFKVACHIWRQMLNYILCMSLREHISLWWLTCALSMLCLYPVFSQWHAESSQACTVLPPTMSQSLATSGLRWRPFTSRDGKQRWR